MFIAGTPSADGPLDGARGDTTIGRPEINGRGNGNPILGSNAVKVCGLGLCDAQAIDTEDNQKLSVRSAGRDTTVKTSC